MDALAELAGAAGCVCELSNSCRSRINPAEHEGAHTDGGAGCRAATGSGSGFSGSMIEGGGEVLGVALQLASSSAQAISISLGSQAGEVFGILGLLSDVIGPHLVGGLLLQSLAGVALLGFAVLGELTRHARELGLGAAGAEPLRPRENESQRYQGAEHWLDEAVEHRQALVTNCKAWAYSAGHVSGLGLPGRQVRK